MQQLLLTQDFLVVKQAHRILSLEREKTRALVVQADGVEVLLALLHGQLSVVNGYERRDLGGGSVLQGERITVDHILIRLRKVKLIKINNLVLIGKVLRLRQKVKSSLLHHRTVLKEVLRVGVDVKALHGWN